MPNITFILPHWIYWGGLIAVPLFFLLMWRRVPARSVSEDISPALAWFFWAVGGFMGIHRLYLKSGVAAVFIALFIGVIWCNHQASEARNAHSIARNEVFNADYDLKRAFDNAEADAVMSRLQKTRETLQTTETALAARLEGWRDAATAVAAVILLLLLADALLMPRNVRAARARFAREEARPPPAPSENMLPPDPRDGKFGGAVSRLNALVGEFAAYWTVIAVFVFYYEVIARYIFNSPTIWAHESMFLMFGMQYLLAGGFCLRENAHVRVDVVYMHLSARGKAIAGLVTSVFFFIFSIALMVTGWIFFHDSFAMGQVSHTEWEIPYWPIKFALPLGGLLIMLQGAAHLLRDIAKLRRTPKQAHGH